LLEPDLATHSPRYCYAEWLRHLVIAWENGVRDLPKVVVELGPGSSQGVGLAALLCGAQTYCSIDVVNYQVSEKNREILEGLIGLFSSRAAVPGDDEFPHLGPRLSSYAFPVHVLSDECLSGALDAMRLDAIRAACGKPNVEEGTIVMRHVTLRAGEPELPEHFADMLLSQAVLMFPSDLDNQYGMMYRWLKPGGIMSHQLDYSTENTFSNPRYWNSHWGCSDIEWSLLQWRQAITINRFPHSAHLSFLAKHGFRVLQEVRYRRDKGLPRERLAHRFRAISDDDLQTGGGFYIAQKPRRCGNRRPTDLAGQSDRQLIAHSDRPLNDRIA
jgi:hypothetical protein